MSNSPPTIDLSTNKRAEADSPKKRRRVPIGVITGLALIILLDTSTQLAWKFAAQSMPEAGNNLSQLHEILKHPIFLVVFGMQIAQFFVWMVVLAKADLSYAQPLAALSYVTVAILSAMLLNEKVPAHRIVGIAVILIGVWLIAGTKHKTNNPAKSGEDGGWKIEDGKSQTDNSAFPSTIRNPPSSLQ